MTNVSDSSKGFELTPSERELIESIRQGDITAAGTTFCKLLIPGSAKQAVRKNAKIRKQAAAKSAAIAEDVIGTLTTNVISKLLPTLPKDYGLDSEELLCLSLDIRDGLRAGLPRIATDDFAEAARYISDKRFSMRL